MLNQFEIFLKKNLPSVDSFHPHYNSALGAMLFAGGKRFRPMLLLSTVKAFNPLLLNSAMHAALAIEILHTYSLIHDDLPAMDNASLRRGAPTLHVQYDETTAILVGDALNTYAFELLAKSPFSAEMRVNLIKELALSGGVGGMVLGQAIDCHFENIPLTLENVKFLHNQKTGRLIASSLVMGAIIVGQNQLREMLENFGMRLGLLFQIQDDILDVTQSDEEAGKSTGVDSEKNSFVNLIGVEESIREADALAQSLDKEIEGFDRGLQEAFEQVLKKYLYRHNI